MLPESPIDIRFASLDQRKGDGLLSPGVLTVARNVQQIQEGVFEKRDGYARLNTTTDSGTISSGKDLGVADSELVLVTDDAIYRRDTATAKWMNSGEHRPAFGTYETAINVGGYRPSFCVDSIGNTWHFSGSSRQDGTAGVTDRRPLVRVVDSAGREVFGATQLLGPSPMECGRAFAIGGHVYFMYVVGRALRLYDFTAASPAAVSPSVYKTFNVAASLYGVDVRVTGSTAVVFAWGANLNGTNEAVAVSYFDTSTNLPNVTPGLVYTNFSDNRSALNAGCLLSNNPFSGAVSHSLVAAESDKLEAFTINATTLACTFNTVATGLYFREYSEVCGVDNTSTWTLWRGGDAGPGFPRDPTFDLVRRYVVTVSGWTATSAPLIRGAWLVGDPAVIGSKVYLTVGHEDVLITAPGKQSTQRCFSLLDATTGLALARAMYEVGGGDIDGQAGGFSYSGYIAPIRVDGTKIKLPVGACRDGLNDFYSVILTWETAPVLGPGVQVGDRFMLPGGYPVVVSRDGASDSAPQFFPSTLTVTAAADGGTACPDGTYHVCASFVVIAPNGDEAESQPSEAVEVTTAAQFIRAVVPNLREVSRVFATAKDSKTYIRLYSTTDADTTLYQQKQVLNDPRGDVTTIDIRTPGVGRILYTEGGVVENAPPPPFRVGMEWDNRVFVAKTAEKGVVYPTKYVKTGSLPVFFDDGKFSVGNLEVQAMCPIDQNQAAIFTDSLVAVIPAGGPTDIGTGPYKPVFFEGQTTTNPRSVVKTDKGCLFQGTDGGIWLLTRAIEFVFVGRGVDSYRGSTVTSAKYLKKKQRAVFTLNTGEVLVFDMSRLPLEPKNYNDTIGAWTVYERATPWAPVAGAVINDSHCILNATGSVDAQVDGQAFDGANLFIGMKLRFPITLDGVTGYVRCLRAIFAGDWVGAHRIQLTVSCDGVTQTFPILSLTSALLAWDFRPNPSKASSMTVTIEELQSGSALNKGFKIEGLGLHVQRQPEGKRTLVRAG